MFICVFDYCTLWFVHIRLNNLFRSKQDEQELGFLNLL